MTRRHLAATYALPKDAQEEERLNFQHHLLYTLLKTHYLAPLDAHTDSILDVGTGTGRWCHDMALLFPSAQVTGLDIESAQVTGQIHPPNYHFVQGDIVKNGLPFRNETFSYVHQRLLVGAIPAQRWPTVIGELVRVTRRQGYIELVEGSDCYLNAGPKMQTFLIWGKIATQQAGIDASLMARLDDLLRQAGLHNIHTQCVQAPLGKWDGRAGHLLALDTFHAFKSLQDFYLAHLTITPEAYTRLVNALPEEWEQYQTAYKFYLFYGKKQ